jgi:glutathione S-transferase
MINLYYKPSCPYCLRVLTANQTIKAPLILLNVSADSAHKAALLEKGGKTQVPYLQDVDRGMSLYESEDIIAYLARYYANGIIPFTPLPGNVCPIE